MLNRAGPLVNGLLHELASFPHAHFLLFDVTSIVQSLHHRLKKLHLILLQNLVDRRKRAALGVFSKRMQPHFLVKFNSSDSPSCERRIRPPVSELPSNRWEGTPQSLIILSRRTI